MQAFIILIPIVAIALPSLIASVRNNEYFESITSATA